MLPIYMHGVVQDYLLNQTATICRSSAHTKASQLRLLTVLLPSEEYLAGGSWDPHCGIQPRLPNSCMQFCPNCPWPSGPARMARGHR